MVLEDSNASLSKAFAVLTKSLALAGDDLPDWLFEDWEYRIDDLDAYRQYGSRLEHHLVRAGDFLADSDHLVRRARQIVGEPHWRCSRTKKGVCDYH